MPAGGSAEAAFRILTVCTGNVCRSPATGLLLTRRLGPSVLVESAGTGPLVGAPVDPTVAALLEHSGVSAAGFAARGVTERLVRGADLVLPLTLAHRAMIVDLVPSALRRTFTLREFAHIVASLDLTDVPRPASPGDRLRALASAAPARRGTVRSRPEDLDVPDPFGLGPERHAQSFALIAEAVEVIVEAALGDCPASRGVGLE